MSTITRILHVVETKEVDEKGKESFTYEGTVSSFNDKEELTGSSPIDGAKFFPSAAASAAAEKKADDEKVKEETKANDAENTAREEAATPAVAKPAASKPAAKPAKAAKAPAKKK